MALSPLWQTRLCAHLLSSYQVDQCPTFGCSGCRTIITSSTCHYEKIAPVVRTVLAMLADVHCYCNEQGWQGPCLKASSTGQRHRHGTVPRRRTTFGFFGSRSRRQAGLLVSLTSSRSSTMRPLAGAGRSHMRLYNLSPMCIKFPARQARFQACEGWHCHILNAGMPCLQLSHRTPCTIPGFVVAISGENSQAILRSVSLQQVLQPDRCGDKGS